jgi:hypothetical protein
LGPRGHVGDRYDGIDVGGVRSDAVETQLLVRGRSRGEGGFGARSVGRIKRAVEGAINGLHNEDVND